MSEALFVPGRLCLFGEHSDWAAGYRITHPELSPGACLVAGTDQGLRADAEALDGTLEIESRLGDGSVHGPVRLEATPEALRRTAGEGGFFAHVAGVAAEALGRHGVAGLRLRIESDLPTRAGLSSSAAVAVLTARALSRVHALDLEAREEMDLAYAGERLTGSQCGRMDQVVAFGRTPTSLRFDGDDMRVEPVSAGGDIHLLVVDLRRGKDTRRILADLNACFPDVPGALAARVRAALGPRNVRLVVRARAAVEAGDARALGELMTEAQALFDEDVAPASDELRAPRLHEVLAHAAVGELAHGGKGVGSQGDGCAQLVARGPEERERLAAILEDELGVACLPLTLRRADDD